jgi:hypothetical protein
MNSQSIVGHSNFRAVNDFYPTPPQYTRDIISREKLIGGDIWEPACGDGSMSEVLKETGNSVISTDLVDRGYGYQSDFLLDYRKCSNIVTNPPFGLITKFAYHAYESASKKIIFLAKLAFLETIERRKLFERCPLARIYVYSKRIRFDKNIVTNKTNGGMIAFAWFVWDKSYNGDPIIKFI